MFQYIFCRCACACGRVVGRARACGLVIPDTAQEKPQLGDVIAVGPGRLDDNSKRIPMDVQKGDKVLYAKYSGQEIPAGVYGDSEDYMVLKESDILAKLA